jgi:hypothetical protein
MGCNASIAAKTAGALERLKTFQLVKTVSTGIAPFLRTRRPDAKSIASEDPSWLSLRRSMDARETLKMPPRASRNAATNDASI